MASGQHTMFAIRHSGYGQCAQGIVCIGVKDDGIRSLVLDCVVCGRDLPL
jgi:uncharacterized ferredoxin-like protein